MHFTDVSQKNNCLYALFDLFLSVNYGVSRKKMNSITVFKHEDILAYRIIGISVLGKLFDGVAVSGTP